MPLMKPDIDKRYPPISYILDLSGPSRTPGIGKSLYTEVRSALSKLGYKTKDSTKGLIVYCTPEQDETLKTLLIDWDISGEQVNHVPDWMMSDKDYDRWCRLDIIEAKIKAQYRAKTTKGYKL